MTPPVDSTPDPIGGVRPLTVLVADDEPLIRKALRKLFEKRGHRVETAADAAEALSLIDDHAFDAALVDARMPGSGLTVIERLEDDTSFTGTVMLMSGDLSTDPYLQVGPNVKRLQKPFRFPDIVPLIEGGDRH